MSKRVLRIHPDKCTGGRQCDRVCSLANNGIYATSKSRYLTTDLCYAQLNVVEHPFCYWFFWLALRRVSGVMHLQYQ
jgi:Fe-S-cluster-containing hydrogenase component 2